MLCAFASFLSFLLLLVPQPKAPTGSNLTTGNKFSKLHLHANYTSKFNEEKTVWFFSTGCGSMIIRPTLSTSGIGVHSSMHAGGGMVGKLWRWEAKSSEIPRYKMLTTRSSALKCFWPYYCCWHLVQFQCQLYAGEVEREVFGDDWRLTQQEPVGITGLPSLLLGCGKLL